MTVRTFLRKFITRFSLRFSSRASSVQILQQKHLAASNITQSEKGARLFLNVSSDDAFEIANCAQAAYTQLLTAAPVASAELMQCHSALEQALQQSSCLLALPFNLPALQLLQQIAKHSQQAVLIVETGAVRETLREMNLLQTCLRLLPAKEVIRHVKEAKASGSEHFLVVSFPETHLPSNATSMRQEFAGNSYSFSLLEPLLCCSGLPTLLNLCATPAGALQILSLAIAPLLAGGSNQAIPQIAAWLAEQLQHSARAMPKLTMAWQYLFRASDHFRAIERSDKLKQLEAYFDVWKNSNAGLDAATYQLMKSRLLQLRAVK